MSRVSWGAGTLSVVFLLACMGESAPPPKPAPAPAPAPAATEEGGDEEAGEGEEGDETPDGAEEGEGTEGEGTAEGSADDGEFWCCQYDGPLGKTHALLDNPKECTDQFGSNGGEFVKGAQCEPVCCKYAEDPADLGKGYKHEVVASSNCGMRKGETVEPTAEVCPDLLPEGAEDDKPAAKPRPRPKPRGPMTRPGTGTAPAAPRPGTGGRLQPKPGGLTRPGG